MKNDITTFYEVFKYDHKVKEWKHMGYKCIDCHGTFLRESTLPKHIANCMAAKAKDKRKRKKGPGRDPDESVTILDVSGKVWKPIDFNQKKS